MSGRKIIEGLHDAVAIAKGEKPAAAIWHQRHRYVPDKRRPDVFVENLLSAARLYGDARVAQRKALYNRATESREAFHLASTAAKEAESDLERAARAYATNVRKKAKRAPSAATRIKVEG